MPKITSISAASLLVLSGVVLSSASYADGKKIVKWVDSSGVTHYGDKLPAQEAGRNNVEMNNQGIVVKQNNISDKKNEVIDQQKLEQERKEKTLLASYTNPEEIDLARDRNLQLDQAAIQALTQQKINITTRTARNNKTAQSFQARKKPLPPYLIEELKLSKTESANVEKQLMQRKLSMEATRKHYAEEKARFIALKYPDGAPATVTESSAKPSYTPKTEASATAISEATKTRTPTTTKPVTKITPAKP